MLRRKGHHIFILAKKKLTLALKIRKKNETQTKKELNKAVNKGSDWTRKEQKGYKLSAIETWEVA